jgi:TPR repeat protein
MLLMARNLVVVVACCGAAIAQSQTSSEAPCATQKAEVDKLAQWVTVSTPKTLPFNQAKLAAANAALKECRSSEQLNRGNMYSFGKGVPQDYKEAVRLYRLAAEQGNTAAQFNLGSAYYNGLGVPQNDIQAYMWFILASTGGDADDIKTRDDVAATMTPGQIAEAERLAREWLQSHKR